MLVLVHVTVGVPLLATELIGETGGTFVAAVNLAAAANVLARSPRRPPRLVLLPGFFTLTVGSLGMRGLTALSGCYVVGGFGDLLKMVTTVTAIAAGMLLGVALTEEVAGARGRAGEARRGYDGWAVFLCSCTLA
ncbi:MULTISPECIES: hypothetical protein [unclassified Streptomyces]|uniref:hypothetical protein n=1 Tax=unclassified Streptomyces TaxID=2593676 RepID=UPI00225A3D22|nr:MULTISPECIES: hypothetical protein [unclassified Streptomyces]WSP56437.1 hypothetical protein OG306_20270 [Streptomyces sp. NBC_01241]WSU22846.1 hypothetical protein OG508_18970 [Streptomyces sp. NBC_01108]MCX4788171.1 hypothetical protein [Streptomyces sp. NBC_01221]MCX4796072.1 hypothetical protein [Streptomyces sp. NBC_01242]WSJ37334.1 hypothetical protein OG772_15655 [Streptomyces sp. NBC_01321]